MCYVPVCLIAYVLPFQAECAPPLYCAGSTWEFVHAAWRRNVEYVHGVEHVHGVQLCEGTMWKWELVAPYHFELRSSCFKRHRLCCTSILTWYRGNCVNPVPLVFRQSIWQIQSTILMEMNPTTLMMISLNRRSD